MALTFYPHEEDIANASVEQKLEIFLEAAERYKAALLDVMTVPGSGNLTAGAAKSYPSPKDMQIAFNWDEIAKLLKAIRELSESNPTSKRHKAEQLTKLAEIYESLRSAKMPKLEAVRLALVHEANQMLGSTPRLG